MTTPDEFWGAFFALNRDLNRVSIGRSTDGHWIVATDAWRYHAELARARSGPVFGGAAQDAAAMARVRTDALVALSMAPTAEYRAGF